MRTSSTIWRSITQTSKSAPTPAVLFTTAAAAAAAAAISTTTTTTTIHFLFVLFQVELADIVNNLAINHPNVKIGSYPNAAAEAEANAARAAKLVAISEGGQPDLEEWDQVRECG